MGLERYKARLKRVYFDTSVFAFSKAVIRYLDIFCILPYTYFWIVLQQKLSIRFIKETFKNSSYWFFNSSVCSLVLNPNYPLICFFGLRILYRWFKTLVFFLIKKRVFKTILKMERLKYDVLKKFKETLSSEMGEDSLEHSKITQTLEKQDFAFEKGETDALELTDFNLKCISQQTSTCLRIEQYRGSYMNKKLSLSYFLIFSCTRLGFQRENDIAIFLKGILLVMINLIETLVLNYFAESYYVNKRVRATNYQSYTSNQKNLKLKTFRAFGYVLTQDLFDYCVLGLIEILGCIGFSSTNVSLKYFFSPLTESTFWSVIMIRAQILILKINYFLSRYTSKVIDRIWRPLKIWDSSAKLNYNKGCISLYENHKEFNMFF